MVWYIKTLILLVTLAHVNSMALQQNLDSEVDMVSDGEEAAGTEIDLREEGNDGEENEDDILEVELQEGESGKPSKKVLSKIYARRHEIAKLVLFMKIINDGIQLKNGMDQISHGIEIKKTGYQEVLHKDTIRSGLEKSIKGDELVLSGMRQSGRALLHLGMDGAFAGALYRLQK